MRVLVFILAFLGSLATGGLGLLVQSVIKKQEAANFTPELRARIAELEGLDDEALRQRTGKDPKEFREALGLLRNLRLLGYALLGACPAAMLGGFLALGRKKLLAALLLLVAAGGPAYLTQQLQAVNEKLPPKPGEADPKPFFTMILVAIAPLAAGALFSLLIGRPRVEEEPEDDEEPAPRSAPRRRSAAPVEAPPPPGPPVATFKCPKCAKALKKTNAEAGKPLKCPGCATTFPIPAKAVELARAAAERAQEEYEAARAAAEEQQDSEPEKEEEEAPRKTRKSPPRTSKAKVFWFVLLVGGTIAFSVLAALGVISINPPAN